MEPKVPSVIAKAQIRPMNAESTATQPHLATVLLQQELLKDWYRAASSYPRGSNQRYASFRWAFNTIAEGLTRNPYVRSRCTPAQDLSANPMKASLYFLLDKDTPLNANGNIPWSATPRNISIASLERAASPTIRTQWIRLPVTGDGATPGGPSFLGVLIDFPTNDESRTAIACSIDAAWRERKPYADSFSAAGAWGVDSIAKNRQITRVTLADDWLRLLLRNNDDSRNQSRMHGAPVVDQMLEDAGYAEISYRLRSTPQLLLDPKDGVCKLGKLNASSSDADLWDDSCGRGAKFQLVETALASLIADGMSRYGSHRVYQPTAVDPQGERGLLQDLLKKENFQEKLLVDRDAVTLPKDPNIVVQRISIRVAGYAYYASTTTDYLATAVSVMYILLALAHTLWVLATRITSSSWDSATELVALCLDSPAPAVLRNTSAGIGAWETYKAMARVRIEDGGLSSGGVVEGQRRVVLTVDSDSLAGSQSDNSADSIGGIDAMSTGNDVDSMSEARCSCLQIARVNRNGSKSGVKVGHAYG